MKKYVSVFLAALFVVSCCVPFVAAAQENVNVSDNVISVDYQKFSQNKSYYDALALQGYGICVQFEGCSDAEIEGILETLGLPRKDTQPTNHSQNQRGTSVPTTVWNIHENGKVDEISCEAKYQTIYSKYKYTGCTLYMVQLTNYDSDNKLRMTVYGGADGTQYYGISPQSFFYTTITTSSSTDKVFLAFSPPSNMAGKFMCCPAS